MCGIAGFIDTDVSQIDGNKILKNMLEQINHRGPDSSGAYINKERGIYIGHVRLSIIDLTDTGHQPMISEDGRWVISYNGEIYNHKAIKDEINNKFSLKWRGSSDTEVLLKSIQVYGLKKAITKSTGMFAFSLWDSKERKLFLVRDRFGEKPLYFSVSHLETKPKITFGSELKIFKQHPSFREVINYEAVYDYFKTMTINGSKTIFKNVHKVNPGEYVEIDLINKSVTETKYWCIGEANVNSCYAKLTDNELIDELDIMLNKTIHDQMLADVPVGSFLSGGIDSSLVTSIMQSQSNKQISTFSIGFEDPKYNEAEDAKKIASFIGTNHTELILHPNDALKIIPNIPNIYNEPFADPSQIPTYLLTSLVSKNIKVALSGDAGDEVFGGYNRHLFMSQYWPYLSKIPLPIRSQLASILPRLVNNKYGRLIGRSFSDKWQALDSLIVKASRLMKFSSSKDIYQSMISVAWDDDCLFLENIMHDSVIRDIKVDNHDILEYMQAMDIVNYLPNDILTKVDRSAMSVSLETRIPFLDHNIVNFGLNLPKRLKIMKTRNNFGTKIILRRLLSKYIPEELTNRKKMGFGIPLQSWISGPLKEWVMDTLTHESSKKIGIFDHSVIENHLSDHMNGKIDNSEKIWTLLIFYDWYSKNL